MSAQEKSQWCAVQELNIGDKLEEVCPVVVFDLFRFYICVTPKTRMKGLLFIEIFKRGRTNKTNNKKKIQSIFIYHE